MTTYAVSGAPFTFDGSPSTPLPALAIAAGLYEVKINRIEYGFTYLDGKATTSIQTIYYLLVKPSVNLRVGGSSSGGSAVVPSPMREGSGAASATARWGQVSISGSGSSAKITNLPILSAIKDVSEATIAFGSNNTYDFPYDFTISPGSLGYLLFDLDYYGLVDVELTATIYMEELRLSWPY